MALGAPAEDPKKFHSLVSERIFSRAWLTTFIVIEGCDEQPYEGN